MTSECHCSLKTLKIKINIKKNNLLWVASSSKNNSNEIKSLEFEIKIEVQKEYMECCPQILNDFFFNMKNWNANVIFFLNAINIPVVSQY